MTVFRKELRGALGALLVWSGIIGGLMAVCVALYPSMAGSVEEMSALFAGMGEFSAAFGLDKLEFGSIMGFYGTECGNILGLGGALFAAVMAIGLLAGEEGGHTAEFLLTHPISRRAVVGEKLAALGVMILVLEGVCLGCGLGSVAAIGEECRWGELLRYHGAVALAHLELGGAVFGLSAVLRRGGVGPALGLAVAAWFGAVIINLDEGLRWLRFVTPFYFADAHRVLGGEKLMGSMAVTAALAAASCALGIWWYGRKDIAA